VLTNCDPLGAEDARYLKSCLIPLCPPSLEVLRVGGSIEFPLPTTLKFLTIGVYGKLPDSLIGLKAATLNSLFPLPPNLQYLELYQGDIPPLPSSLTHLILTYPYLRNKPKIKKLPNLTHLSFHGNLRSLYAFVGSNLSSVVVHCDERYTCEIYRHAGVVNLKVIFKYTNQNSDDEDNDDYLDSPKGPFRGPREDLLEITNIDENNLTTSIFGMNNSLHLWESNYSRFGKKKYV